MTAATYADYDAVASLDPDTLRGLVRGGLPAERVWAAWRLALLVGPAADRDLTAALAEEPTAGVRAHWVIVLFSHGELDLVCVLAQYDPSPLVRETAVRYLAPTVGRSASVLVGPALAACLTDAAPRVRQTAVRHLPAEPGPELMARVTHLASDGDAQVRMAALEYLVRHRGVSVDVLGPYIADPDVHVRRRAVAALAAAPGGDTAWALERIGVEEDEDARDRLTTRLLDAGREADLARHLAAEAPLMIHDVMAPLARSERHFPWSALAPLFGACPDSATLLVLCAIVDTDTIPATTVRVLVEEATAYYEGEELWLPHLIQITRPLVERLSAEDRQSLHHLQDILQDELVAARAQKWGPIEKLEALIAQLNGS